MKTTASADRRQIRTIFSAERSRLLGMETTVARPARRVATFSTGR